MDSGENSVAQTLPDQDASLARYLCRVPQQFLEHQSMSRRTLFLGAELRAADAELASLQIAVKA